MHHINIYKHINVYKVGDKLFKSIQTAQRMVDVLVRFGAKAPSIEVVKVYEIADDAIFDCLYESRTSGFITKPTVEEIEEEVEG